MELPTLQGDGVMLRPWRSADSYDLHREIQDPEVVRWLDIELPYTAGDAEGFIAAAPQRWSDRTAAHFALESEGTFAGYLGLLALEPAMQVVEVVYWVAAAHRGRGVASAALAAALPWAAEVVRPRRVEAGMAAGNLASRAVVEANGFELAEVRPGAGRLNGVAVDEWIFVWTGSAS